VAIGRGEAVNRDPAHVGDVPVGLTKVWAIRRSRVHPGAYDLEADYGGGDSETFTFRINARAVEFIEAVRLIARSEIPTDKPPQRTTGTEQVEYPDRVANAARG